MRSFVPALLLTSCAVERPDPTPDPVDPTDLPPVAADTGDTFAPLDTGAPVEPTCDALAFTAPSAGARDVFFQSVFYVEFTRDQEDDAVLALREKLSGRRVPTGPISWSEDGDIASFRPPDGLAPDTDHVWVLQHSCGTDRVPFRTSPTGRARVRPDDVLGNTYVIDLSTATFVSPPGIHTLLSGSIGMVDYHVAFQPTALDAEAGTLSFTSGAFSTGGWQDPCTPTTRLPPADFSGDPLVRLHAPEGLTFSIARAGVRLLDLDLTTAFSPDGATMDGLTLEGMLDVRTVGDVFGLPGGAVCGFIKTIADVACVDCPDGSGVGCVDALIANITAHQHPDWTLQEITEEQAAAEPFCF